MNDDDKILVRALREASDADLLRVAQAMRAVQREAPVRQAGALLARTLMRVGAIVQAYRRREKRADGDAPDGGYSAEYALDGIARLLEEKT